MSPVTSAKFVDEFTVVEYLARKMVFRKFDDVFSIVSLQSISELNS